jgi:hypothetical protein
MKSAIGVVDTATGGGSVFMASVFKTSCADAWPVKLMRAPRIIVVSAALLIVAPEAWVEIVLF